MTYKLYVELHDTEPLVWRRLLVPEVNFAKLPTILQLALGWENSHAYEFMLMQNDEEIRIGLPDEDMPDVVAATKTRMSKHFAKTGLEMGYVYDLGDSWEHTIRLEEVSYYQLDVAVCLEGSGKCPPEDVGGVPGYYDWLETINDPKHPEHDEMRKWRGMSSAAKWDPEYFDIVAANAMLQNLMIPAKARKPAKRMWVKTR